MHQAFGPCSARDHDILGNPRASHVCTDTAEYSLCGKRPPDGQIWYEVCGKMGRVSAEEATYMLAYTVLGSALIVWGLGTRHGVAKPKDEDARSPASPPASPSTAAKTPKSPSTRARSPK